MSDEPHTKALDFLNAEMDRHWTRFNIFSAVQVGAVVGALSSLELLSRNPPLFRFFLSFMLLFSIIGALAVLRGLDLQRSLVSGLLDLEQGLRAEERLVGRVRNHFFLPIHFGNYVSSAFSFICCLAWLLAWIWLEWTGYTGLQFPPLNEMPR